MKIVLRFSKIIFTLFIFSLAGFVDAQSSKWDEASSGNHSIRQLGPDFFEDIPMKKIEGARLVLFNSRAANEIGLDLPRNPKYFNSRVSLFFCNTSVHTKFSLILHDILYIYSFLKHHAMANTFSKIRIFFCSSPHIYFAVFT